MPQLMECRHAFALCECGIEYRDNRGSAESFPQRSHQTRLTLDREHTLRLEPVEQRLRPVSRVRPASTQVRNLERIDKGRRFNRASHRLRYLRRDRAAKLASYALLPSRIYAWRRIEYSQIP